MYINILFFVKQIKHFNNIESICKTCQPKLKNSKGSVINTTNFVKHLKTAYQYVYTEYLKYKKEKRNVLKIKIKNLK